MVKGKNLLLTLALGVCTIATMIVESVMMRNEVKDEVKEQLEELNKEEEA